MKDKYDRVKQFVQRHSVVFAYSAGATIGVAATTYVSLKHPLMPKEIEVFVSETPEQLMSAMSNTGISCLRLNGGKTAVYLYTGVDLESL